MVQDHRALRFSSRGACPVVVRRAAGRTLDARLTVCVFACPAVNPSARQAPHRLIHSAILPAVRPLRRFVTSGTRPQTPYATARSLNPRAQGPKPRPCSPHPRRQRPEPRPQAPNPSARSPNTRAQSPDPGAETPSCTPKTPEPRRQSPHVRQPVRSRSRRAARVRLPSSLKKSCSKHSHFAPETRALPERVFPVH